MMYGLFVIIINNHIVPQFFVVTIMAIVVVVVCQLNVEWIFSLVFVQPTERKEFYELNVFECVCVSVCVCVCDYVLNVCIGRLNVNV